MMDLIRKEEENMFLSCDFVSIVLQNAISKKIGLS